MAKIRITQTKSKIGSTKRQKQTLQALGLKKLNSQVEVEDNDAIKGMVNKVKHLVIIEKL